MNDYHKVKYIVKLLWRLNYTNKYTDINSLTILIIIT